MNGRLKIKAAELSRPQLIPGAGAEPAAVLPSAVPWQHPSCCPAAASPPGSAAVCQLVSEPD